MRIESTSSRRGSLGVALLLALGLAAFPSVASADGRVALVVGNSAYAAIGTLPNPGNDAADVSAALGRLGFDVTTVRDADRVGLNEALRTFTRQSVGADVALVFYAGHGLEMDGVNYLVPVDARLERDTDVRFETVALDDVLAATAGASLRVVVLDACRNNPLAGSMQRTSVTRSVSRGSFGELHEGLLGDQTLVAYAAAAGTTADDGTGRNSPYTEALLTHLEQPLEIGILFREVRARVLEATDGRQRPHEYASLLGEHYLRGVSGAGTVTVTVADNASADVRAQQENLFWQSIAASEDPADFRAYLQQFPNGVFALLARNRLAALNVEAGDPPAVDRPRPADDAPAAADPPGSTSGRTFRDCEACPEMVVVPAGRFRMGCVSGRACSDNQLPVHEVEIASFALGMYEVTFEEYDRFVQATGYRRPDDREGGRGRRPVIYVSWNDAVAYAAWLSSVTGQQYRLPSESEWEYAARAGTPPPVGSSAANAWGLHDMTRNVYEWVQDCWHDDYRGAPDDGSAWQRSRGCGFGFDSRVRRGGSSSAGRYNREAGARFFNGGFRVSRTLD